MGFVKDLKVAHKLAIIGVLAFIATLVVGWVGYSSLKSAQQNMEELYNEDTMSIYYCAKVRYNTRYSQIQASLQPYTILPDRRQDRITKFNNAINEAEEYMKKYEMNKIVPNNLNFQYHRSSSVNLTKINIKKSYNQ